MSCCFCWAPSSGLCRSRWLELLPKGRGRGAGDLSPTEIFPTSWGLDGPQKKRPAPDLAGLGRWVGRFSRPAISLELVGISRGG